MRLPAERWGAGRDASVAATLGAVSCGSAPGVFAKRPWGGALVVAQPWESLPEEPRAHRADHPRGGPAVRDIESCQPASKERERGGADTAHIPLGASRRRVNMPHMWHTYGMPRIRVSTTVDETLLANARELRSDLNDAALLDAALAALAAVHRAAEIDQSYSAYEQHPLDEPDEWGDLASFREAAATS